MSLNADTKKVLTKFCQRQSIKFQFGWENFTRSIQLPDTLVLDIECVDDLQKLLRFVKRLNKTQKEKNPRAEKITLRMASGGDDGATPKDRRYNDSFSMTACMAGDIIARLSGSDFKNVELLDKKKRLIRAGAGVQIGKLDKTLYEQFRLRLGTSSLIPYPRFSALAANGGHGTGRDQPGVAGLIKAITIMRPDGKIVRLSADDKDPQVRRDFEIIRSCHLGLFGVVLDMEIECEEGEKFRCIIDAKNLDEFKKDVANGLFQKHEYVSVMYTPTYRNNEGKVTCPANVKTIIWERVPKDTPKVGDCADLEKTTQDINIAFSESFEVTDILAKYPDLIPCFMQYFVSTAQIGKDKSYVADAPDIFHYQQAFPRSLLDADFLFNVSKDGHEILRAIEIVETKLRTLAKIGVYPIVYAIYLRYFKGTTGGLSPSFADKDQHVCGMDFTSARGIPGFAEFIEQLKPIFFSELKARPHWGKDVPLDVDYKKMYGQHFTDFMDVLKRWYADCGMTIEESALVNPFFEAILQLNKDKKGEPQPSSPEEEPLADRTALKESLQSLKERDEHYKKTDAGKQLHDRVKAKIKEEKKRSVHPATLFAEQASPMKSEIEVKPTTVSAKSAKRL